MYGFLNFMIIFFPQTNKIKIDNKGVTQIPWCWIKNLRNIFIFFWLLFIYSKNLKSINWVCIQYVYFLSFKFNFFSNIFVCSSSSLILLISSISSSARMGWHSREFVLWLVEPRTQSRQDDSNDQNDGDASTQCQSQSSWSSIQFPVSYKTPQHYQRVARGLCRVYRWCYRA